jgi:hypothetical protein
MVIGEAVTPMRVEVDPDFKLPDDDTNDDSNKNRPSAIVHVGRAKIAGGRRKGTTMGFKGASVSAPPTRAAGISIVAATPKAAAAVVPTFTVVSENGTDGDAKKDGDAAPNTSDTTTPTVVVSTGDDKSKDADPELPPPPATATTSTNGDDKSANGDKPKEPDAVATEASSKTDADTSSTSTAAAVDKSPSTTPSTAPSIPSSPPPSLPSLPPPAVPSTPLPKDEPKKDDSTTNDVKEKDVTKPKEPSTPKSDAKKEPKKIAGLGLALLSPEQKRQQDEAKRKAKEDAAAASGAGGAEATTTEVKSDDTEKTEAEKKAERLKKMGALNPLAGAAFITPEQKKKKDEEAAKAKADKAKADAEKTDTPAATAVDEKPKVEKVAHEKEHPKAAITVPPPGRAPAKLEKQGSSSKIGGIAAQLAAAAATGTGSGEHPKAVARQDSKPGGRLVTATSGASAAAAGGDKTPSQLDSPNPPATAKKIPLGGFNPFAGKMLSPEEQRKKQEAEAKVRADREAANAETEGITNCSSSPSYLQPIVANNILLLLSMNSSGQSRG